MKWVKIIVLGLALCVGASGCTTSKSVVSDSANLAKYKYVSLVDVMSYRNSAYVMDAEVKIYDALAKTNLQVVAPSHIYSMTDEQLGELLLARYGVTSNTDECVVTVNFVDFVSGAPVASCRGAFGLGIGPGGDFNGAIKKVGEQIRKTFGTETPSIADP